LAVKFEDYVNGSMVRWKRYLYSYKTSKFPAGMLPLVLTECDKRSVRVNFRDDRKIYTPKPLPDSLPVTLHDHQREAIEAAIKNVCGIVKHPTASGKTLVAACIALQIPGNVLFIADEIGLLNSARGSWLRLSGERAGLFGGGKRRLERFTAASFSSLRHNMKSSEVREYLDSVVCMLVDECHVAAAPSYWKVLMSIPAFWRIGFSATPFDRSDSMNPYVAAALGPIIHEVTMGALDGIRTVPPKVAFYDYSYKEAEYYPSDWRSLITVFRPRQKAVLSVCQVCDKPVLVFFEWKQHGYNLCKAARHLGMSADIVSGSDNANTRKRMIEKLEVGSIDVLFASRIFNKGVDIPSLKTCVNAAGQKAFITAIQRLGRGTRIAEGKRVIHYIDFIDNAHPTSLNHSRERYKIYKEKGLEVCKFKSLEDLISWLSLQKSMKMKSNPFAMNISKQRLVLPVVTNFTPDCF